MNIEIVQTMRVLADIGEIAGIVFWGMERRQSTHRLNVLWRSIQIQSAKHQQVIADDADHLIVL